MRNLTKAQGDQLVIDNLRKLGANFAQPRELIHFLYFPTEDAARQVAEELKRRGYSVTQAPAPGMDKPRLNPFSVIAASRVVVNSGAIQEFRQFFEQLAEFHQGEYDGWEAACEP